jgi:hypothetical protein
MDGGLIGDGVPAYGIGAPPLPTTGARAVLDTMTMKATARRVVQRGKQVIAFARGIEVDALRKPSAARMLELTGVAIERQPRSTDHRPVDVAVGVDPRVVGAAWSGARRAAFKTRTEPPTSVCRHCG